MSKAFYPYLRGCRETNKPKIPWGYVLVMLVILLFVSCGGPALLGWR